MKCEKENKKAQKRIQVKEASKLIECKNWIFLHHFLFLFITKKPIQNVFSINASSFYHLYDIYDENINDFIFLILWNELMMKKTID
jgi:hypothetical protein